MFWEPGLVLLPVWEWEKRQGEIFGGDDWIADGDLGPYDALDIRLGKADAVVLLDVPLRTCVWRTLRRSCERLDYWRWLLSWHRRYRPRLLTAVAAHPEVRLLVARNTTDIEQAMNELNSVK